MQNLSYENEFDLHEKEPVGETYFHMNGFAGRHVLTLKLPVQMKVTSIVLF